MYDASALHNSTMEKNTNMRMSAGTVAMLSAFIPGFQSLSPLVQALLGAIAASDREYAAVLATRIEKADQEDISSLDSVARNHPDLTDFTLEKAREKIREGKGTYSTRHKTDQNEEVVSFEKAVNMLKGLLDITSKSLWLDTDLSNTLTDVLGAAVRMDEGFFTRKAYDGYGSFEHFPVKEDRERVSGLHFCLAYVYLDVTTTSVNRFFRDKSKVRVQTEFRVIEFRRFDSFFAWAMDEDTTGGVHADGQEQNA